MYRVFSIIHFPTSKLIHNVYTNDYTTIKYYKYSNIWHSYVLRPTMTIFREMVNKEGSGHFII